MKKLNRNQQSVIPRLLENSARGGAWMRMFFMLVIMMMSSAFAMAQGKYGFKVAGVDVTNDNYLDLTEINGVSGKVYSNCMRKENGESPDKYFRNLVMCSLFATHTLR